MQQTQTQRCLLIPSNSRIHSREQKREPPSHTQTAISFSALVVEAIVPVEFHAHLVARAVGGSATVRIFAASPTAETFKVGDDMISKRKIFLSLATTKIIAFVGVSHPSQEQLKTQTMNQSHSSLYPRVCLYSYFLVLK